MQSARILLNGRKVFLFGRILDKKSLMSIYAKIKILC